MDGNPNPFPVSDAYERGYHNGYRDGYANALGESPDIANALERLQARLHLQTPEPVLRDDRLDNGADASVNDARRDGRG